MTTRTYRLHWGRAARLLVGLLPLIGFPVAYYLMGDVQPGLFVFFGAIALVLIGALSVTALRFKLVINDEELHFRGRVKTRRIRFEDIRAAEIRRGRDKATRFMGPPPFIELVLHTDDRKLVISSLPLGEDAFAELLTVLGEKLPDQIMGQQPQTP